MKLYLSLGILYLIESAYLYRVTNEPIVSGVFLCIGLVSILLNIEKLSMAIAFVSVALLFFRAPIQYEEILKDEIRKASSIVVKPANKKETPKDPKKKDDKTKVPSCNNASEKNLQSCLYAQVKMKDYNLKEKGIELKEKELALKEKSIELENQKELEKKIESKVSMGSVWSLLLMQIALSSLMPLAICLIEINRDKFMPKEPEQDKLKGLSESERFLLLHKQGYTFKQIGQEMKLNKTKVYRIANRLNLIETKVKQSETGVKLRRVN